MDGALKERDRLIGVVGTMSAIGTPNETTPSSAASSTSPQVTPSQIPATISSSSSSPSTSPSESPSTSASPSPSTNEPSSTSNTASSAPQTSNTSPPATSAPPSSSTTSAPPSTSVVSSTSVLTSNGQVITTVIINTTTIAPGAVVTSPGSQHNSSTNVGAIVGGVVGGTLSSLPPQSQFPILTSPPTGVAALALLTLLTLLLLRRHRRNREKYLFDGNFDPAHVVPPTAPRISVPEDDDADDDGMGGRLGSGVGGVVMPFQYVPETERGAGQPEMRGVGSAVYAMNQGSGRHAYTPSMSASDEPGSASASASGYLPNPFSSSETAYMGPQSQGAAVYPNLNVYPAAGAQRATSVSSHGASSTSHSHSRSGSGTGTGTRSAKEREAFGRGGAMGVANPDSSDAAGVGGSAGAGRGRGRGSRAVPIVHRDGGRVVEVHEEEEEEGEEIPPTYESIPR
ncbi:hypothetical protein C0995_013385 [Termitomyces sp. Mi166|nr:hypothetical protein C0995_013385 [Termitomyces sp. Mi166\